MLQLTLPLKLDLKLVHLTDDQFYQLCINNPELIIERSAQGALIVMAPVGGDSGSREADNIVDLGIWNRQTQLGKLIANHSCLQEG